jgi:hypothetical protein
MSKEQNNLRAELLNIGSEIQDEKERHNAAMQILFEKKKKIIDALNDEFAIDVIKK